MMIRTVTTRQRVTRSRPSWAAVLLAAVAALLVVSGCVSTNGSHRGDVPLLHLGPLDSWTSVEALPRGTVVQVTLRDDAEERRVAVWQASLQRSAWRLLEPGPHRGRIVGHDAVTLELAPFGRGRERWRLRSSQVEKVRLVSEGSDSVANGALLGGLAGFVAGALLRSSEEGDRFTVVLTPLGLGLGLLFDASHTSPVPGEIVYRAPQPRKTDRDGESEDPASPLYER